MIIWEILFKKSALFKSAACFGVFYTSFLLPNIPGSTLHCMQKLALQILETE